MANEKNADAEKIAAFMTGLIHPLKKEIEIIRTIIKKASPKLRERIKWNAPSYYYIDDIVTFGPMKKDIPMLVFHHPLIVKIKSPLLQGDYKDRRLAFFPDMKSVKENKKELERILHEMIALIDAGS